ncbi:zinc ABC transporter substrate-binding protein [Litorisediminicola beolgyonensis]|uniref:High-affinity zinc uptake system protein ZnuA n=1 Tax=Litorisediminicola beolgyonensis TaxID=1173614 RepID=A0ABW3ZD18_9RHOB
MRTLCLALLCATPLRAEPPAIAADIAPVHSLVAGVLGDLGEPSLILPPGASPHDHALRPSEARALSEADLVVWIGSELTPQLERNLEALAQDARLLTLADLPGTRHRPARTEPLFEDAHDEAHGHDDHADEDEHAHEDEHGHEDEHKDAHAEEDAHGHDAHVHDGDDPHLWLDPENARVWVAAIAAALSDADPDNAETYSANAAEMTKRIEAAETETRETLAASDLPPLVLMHDSLGHYEAVFGLSVLGSISPSDAEAPSPTRMTALRDALPQGACLVASPGSDMRFAQALGSDLSVTEADPLGAEITPGADLYPALLTGLATALTSCKTPG